LKVTTSTMSCLVTIQGEGELASHALEQTKGKTGEQKIWNKKEDRQAPKKSFRGTGTSCVPTKWYHIRISTSFLPFSHYYFS
jgi:hypothetical protein